MLAYLDALCDAMVARDLTRLRDLVNDHPLARLLPSAAMSEVRRFLAGRTTVHAVPMTMLRFRDQTARLLSEAPRTEQAPSESSTVEHVPALVSRRARQGRRGANQMELPLSA
jgi:hypothetical protein